MARASVYLGPSRLIAAISRPRAGEIKVKVNQFRGIKVASDGELLLFVGDKTALLLPVSRCRLLNSFAFFVFMIFFFRAGKNDNSTLCAASACITTYWKIYRRCICDRCSDPLMNNAEGLHAIQLYRYRYVILPFVELQAYTDVPGYYTDAVSRF